jgi:diguanylate cyclase
MDANVGLAIQCVGILLLTLLSVFMRSSMRSPSLNYWTAAWTSLSVALFSLFIGFHVVTEQRPFYAIYFFGEYLFGLLFLAGCRNYAKGFQLARKHLYVLIPAFLMAVLLPYVSADFNDLFMIHATMISALFAASFFASRRSVRPAESTPGTRVLSAALILLSLDFLHYVPVFAARKGLWGVTIPAGYLQYTSIFDLILEILLGFGAIMVLMEGVRREVEIANEKLTTARDQLELLARMDPLTQALNRHAFHSLLSHAEGGCDVETSGCVAVLDIDGLKPINDTFGHAAGDKAIRAVAKAMRSLVRADDMLFRWGGDEFLMLMFKLPEAEAKRRMATLNQILKENGESWLGIPVTVTVSYGVAGFNSLAELGMTIETADKEMYKQRQLTRSSVRSTQERMLV